MESAGVPERVIRWTAIGLGALLALAVVCALLLRLLFDPNDYRRRIELAFNERTGRTLELEGDLRLKLLPRLAVSTGPLSISDRAGAGDFLTVQDARVGLALWPLLRRRVELGRLTLVEPVVALRIDADGHDNWSDLLKPTPATDPLDVSDAEPIPAPEETADLSIAGLAIEDGRLSFVDARRSRRLQLIDLRATTGALAFDVPTPIRASFALEKGGQPGLRAVVTGRVGRARSRLWTVEDLRVGLERTATPDGRSEPLIGRIEAANIAADLDARRYSAPELRYQLAGARGEASLEAAQTDEGLVVEGPVTLERTDLRALMAALGMPLPAFKDAEAPGKIELKAALRYGPGFALRDLVAVLNDTRITGSLERDAGPQGTVRFDLRADRLVLDDYLPATRVEAAPAVAAARPAASKDRFRALDVRGRLAVGRLQLAGMELSNLDGSVTLSGGTLALDPLRASVFGGTSQTVLKYEPAEAIPRLTLEQRLVDVDAGALLAQLVDERRLSGRGSLTAQVSGAGRGRQALLASLTGPFELQVSDGRFVGVDLWAEIERAVAVARGSTAPRRSGSAYTPFDRFEAQGRLEGTVFRNDRFDVANSSLRAHGRGTVDYGTGALDLALTARLLEAPEGSVAGLSLDRIVGVDIPLTVRGSMSEPRVRPDVNRLLEAAARQQLRLEGEEVKKLKDKLEDTLKDLLGQ